MLAPGAVYPRLRDQGGRREGLPGGGRRDPAGLAALRRLGRGLAAFRPGRASRGGNRIAVLEEERGRGLGGALYDRCSEHLEALGMPRVATLSQDGEDAVAFVRSRGFRPTF